jgi:nucleoside-diphosphate-sugar epimerase
MEDAIRATIELMEAPKEDVKIRSSYNLAGISFTPSELANAISQELPAFQMNYQPDFRQAIADSWPKSIDDTAAKEDWGWKEAYDLQKMVKVMLENVDPTKLK